jgi:ribosomal protein S18 acetylase RimI-like enzyme
VSVDPDSLAAIERSARAALPALREEAAPGWLCRISGGPTKRVNSANPVTPGATLDAVLATAERLYRDACLPVRFRLTPLAAPECDRRLEAAGYERFDPSFTMAAALTDRSIDPGVRIAASADRDWSMGLAAASGWSADDERHHRALLARLPPGSAVATLDEGDGPIAFGAAGLGEGRVWLFDIVVASPARGRGVGRRLVAGLLGRAAAAGHREALLQVLAANAPARALYASLGFVDAYPYHYRVAR